MSPVRRVAIALLAVLLAGCYPELDWREFTWPEGRFTVLLPGKPAQQTRPVTLAGSEVTMALFSFQTEGLAFGVGYADFPPGTPAEQLRRIEAARDALVGNVSGEVTAERAVSLEGHPGRAFRAEGRVADTPYVVAGRVFAVGDRLYQIVFVGRAARAAEADVDVFLESFRLLR